MGEKHRYADGLQVRREVLGDAHVDRSLDALTEFNSGFQEMITRHAWGDIWTRPGLRRSSRLRPSTWCRPSCAMEAPFLLSGRFR